MAILKIRNQLIFSENKIYIHILLCQYRIIICWTRKRLSCLCLHQNLFMFYKNTALPRILPPFTRTWTILPGKWIFASKVDPLNLESQNQAKNSLVGLPSSTIKIWGKSVKELLSYDRRNKQTDKQKLQLYIHRYFSIYFILNKFAKPFYLYITYILKSFW